MEWIWGESAEGFANRIVKSVVSKEDMTPTTSLVPVGYLGTPTEVSVTTHFPDRVPDLLTTVLGVVRGAHLEGVTGRLVETSGPVHDWRLELSVPLSEQDGDELISLFLPDRAESPLEVGGPYGIEP